MPDIDEQMDLFKIQSICIIADFLELLLPKRLLEVYNQEFASSYYAQNRDSLGYLAGVVGKSSIAVCCIIWTRYQPSLEAFFLHPRVVQLCRQWGLTIIGMIGTHPD